MTPGLLSVEEALAAVLGAAPHPLPPERVPVVEALGRVLAEPVVASVDLPPWDNSSMDGYAIRAADVAGATEAGPRRLEVRGEVAAGRFPDSEVSPGTAMRIATGAPLPPGADAVVEVELTTPMDAAGAVGARGRSTVGPLPAFVLVHTASSPGANLRRRGEDLRASTTLLERGRAIGPAEVALSTAAGVPRVTVHRVPKVVVISTGDELRPAGTALGPAGIPDANGPGLVALCAAAGAEALHLGIAPDELGAMTRMLEDAVGRADIVVVSGGVSVGPYDIVRPAFERVGSVALWRVAVQPGKPFAFGVASRVAGTGSANPVLLLGLPGNPVSTFVTFELFVRPLLRRLAGRPDADLLREVDRAVLEEPVAKAPGRRAFLRVTAIREGPAGLVGRDATGRVRVRLAGGQGSHILSALAAADAFAIVPESVDALPAGTPVELWWLDRP
ncbi:MAG TPA: gephyrin-like molybdotransferase Glp [Patescibacteria group bacterium]|nr:gephyrin-like molybdotransferase Glp [Patescibacteria group bacterium]